MRARRKFRGLGAYCDRAPTDNPSIEEIRQALAHPFEEANYSVDGDRLIYGDENCVGERWRGLYGERWSIHNHPIDSAPFMSNADACVARRTDAVRSDIVWNGDVYSYILRRGEWPCDEYRSVNARARLVPGDVELQLDAFDNHPIMQSRAAMDRWYRSQGLQTHRDDLPKAQNAPAPGGLLEIDGVGRRASIALGLATLTLALTPLMLLYGRRP